MQLKQGLAPVTGPSVPLTEPSVPLMGPPFPLQGPSNCLILRSRRPARKQVAGLRPEIGNQIGPEIGPQMKMGKK